MRSVVIVDDDPITRMDLADIMSHAGFAVVGQGGDGFDAVELCDRHTPDLVLMDIKMPVFDGLDATRTIMQKGAAGCVVILTAFNDSEFIARARDFGVAGYLLKPVDERMLLPAVEIAMEQSRRFTLIKGEHDSIRRKLEETRTIDRAKAILAGKNGVSESEAYAMLRKTAMNKSLPLAEVAKSVVAASDDRPEVDTAKRALMERLGIGENAAYRKIRQHAERKGIDMRRAARELSEGGGQ